jgi:hypothetical protein
MHRSMPLTCQPGDANNRKATDQRLPERILPEHYERVGLNRQLRTATKWIDKKSSR